MLKTLSAAAVLIAAAGAATSASAAGCNGVVNQVVWGCAAWDNNNGPQFPNWRGGAAPAAPAPVSVPASSLAARNGSGLVAAGAGNLVAAGAGNLVAAGAGNLQNRNGLVAAGAGNLKPR